VWVNRAGQITFANHQAQQSLHLEASEIDGRTYNAPEWQITDFDGNPYPNDELPFVRVERTREPVFGVEHAINMHGQRILLSINAVPLFDAAGEFDGSVATVADVTERVRTERDLENSERYLRSVIDAIQDGISVLDRDLVITRTNRTMDRWYPHALPLVGKRCHEAYHCTKEPCSPCPSRRTLESGQLESDTMPRISPDGVQGWLDVHAFPLRDKSGQVTGVVEYVRDVSAQRYAQHLLGLQRDMAAALSGADDFDEALDALLDVIVGAPDIDVATLSLRQPDGSSRLVGARGINGLLESGGLSVLPEHPLSMALTRAESVYVDASRLDVELGDQADPLIAQLKAVGIIPVIHEGKVIGSLAIASRSRREFEPSIRNGIESVASQVGGALGRIRAQTELKRYVETQEVLLREVNHRVKNNLAAIISILHKEQDRAEAAGQESYLGLLHEMVARVTSLATVHRLLSESQWRPLPLDGLSRSVVDAVVRAHKSPERVTVLVSPSDVTIESDTAHHVALVLNELATNCLKYGLAGRQMLTLAIEVERQQGETVIRVSDDGPGFPASVLDGERTSGLGLELVQGIVRRTLRGTVALRNDSGASVELRFSRASAGGEA
jgi:PAS domain S-box-containing protein